MKMRSCVSRYGCTGSVHALLEFGADVRVGNTYGMSLLDMAIENGHSDIAQLLLAHEPAEPAPAVEPGAQTTAPTPVGVCAALHELQALQRSMVGPVESQCRAHTAAVVGAVRQWFCQMIPGAPERAARVQADVDNCHDDGHHEAKAIPAAAGALPATEATGTQAEGMAAMQEAPVSPVARTMLDLPGPARQLLAEFVMADSFWLWPPQTLALV